MKKQTVLEELFGTLTKKPQTKIPKCPKCGKDMKPIKNENYCWQCACMPGLVLSSG